MDPYRFHGPDRKHDFICLLWIFPMDIRIGRSRHFLPAGLIQHFTAIFFCISYIYTASYSLDIRKGFYFLLLLLASPLQGGRGRRAAVPHIQKDIGFQFPHCQTENPEKHHNGKGHSGSQDPVPAFITVITFPGKKGGNLLIIISHPPHLTFPSSIRIIRSAIWAISSLCVTNRMVW